MAKKTVSSPVIAFVRSQLRTITITRKGVLSYENRQTQYQKRAAQPAQADPGGRALWSKPDVCRSDGKPGNQFSTTALRRPSADRYKHCY